MADDYDALVLSRANISNYYACDETSGTSLADSAPTNARPLNLTGGFTVGGADLLPGMGGGKSVNYTPTAKALTATTSATGLPAIASGLTIEYWTIADVANQNLPFVGQVSSGNSGIRFTIFSSRWWLQVVRAAGTLSFDTGVSVSAGTVTYLAGGWNGSTAAYAWVNDQKFTFSVTSPSAVNPTFVSIAAEWNDGSPYDGKLSRFAIYNGAQADSLHEEHYDAGINGISSGTLYEETLTATQTFTASRALGAARTLNPSISFSAAVTRATGAARQAMQTFPVTLTRDTDRTVTATATHSATKTNETRTERAASVEHTATTTRRPRLEKTPTQTFTAALGERSTEKTITTNAPFMASLARQARTAVAATQSFTAELASSLVQRMTVSASMTSSALVSTMTFLSQEARQFVTGRRVGVQQPDDLKNVGGKPHN